VWQLAEYLQGRTLDVAESYAIEKSTPPVLPDPLTVCPGKLAQDSSVKWSRSVRITHDTPQLLGTRGRRSSLVVVEGAQAFGGFCQEDAQALAEGTTVSALRRLDLNGVTHETGSLLVALYRHGFIETDESFPTSAPDQYAIEPTCTVVDAAGMGRVAINQLNGRTIRLNEDAQRIFASDRPFNDMQQALYETVIHFVRAGMLRLISGERAHAHH
jgi:hypothetical protein